MREMRNGDRQSNVVNGGRYEVPNRRAIMRNVDRQSTEASGGSDGNII